MSGQTVCVRPDGRHADFDLWIPNDLPISNFDGSCKVFETAIMFAGYF